jgi:RNA polymerase sigma factor (sigma-70 family)
MVTEASGGARESVSMMGRLEALDALGDDALGALYLRSVGRAEALARALTGDPHLAQDVAHDAFIRVAGRFGHLRNRDAFDSYLRAAVVNLCRSHFRRAGVERRVLQRVGVARESAPTHVPEDRDALWAAILALPYRQRAAVVLRFYEDLSEEQTGAVMRCSSRAVNALVSRAMATLRSDMEEER